MCVGVVVCWCVGGCVGMCEIDEYDFIYTCMYNCCLIFCPTVTIEEEIKFHNLAAEIEEYIH